jgi:predicted O-methyltransferase YrrM
MEMTPQRWEYTQAYSNAVFGAQDNHLADLMDAAVAGGLPPIAVSADVGHLLKLLVSTTPGQKALELGTLAGYSAIWIARGLARDGRLTTIEYEPRHAAFATEQIEKAGEAERVEVVVGAALDVLPDLAADWGPESLDFIFLDAVKTEYVDYFKMVRPLLKPGGLIVADNVYGTGAGWIDEGYGTDAFNRLVAADAEFDSAAVPLREGLVIARRK